MVTCSEVFQLNHTCNGENIDVNQQVFSSTTHHQIADLMNPHKVCVGAPSSNPSKLARVWSTDWRWENTLKCKPQPTKKNCVTYALQLNRSALNNFLFERPYQAQIRTSYWSTLTLIENDVVSALQSSYVQKCSQVDLLQCP